MALGVKETAPSETFIQVYTHKLYEVLCGIWYDPRTTFLGIISPYNSLLLFFSFNITELSAYSCIQSLLFLRPALHMWFSPNI